MTQQEKEAHDALIAALETKAKAISKKASEEEVKPILDAIDELKTQIAALVKAQPSEESVAEETAEKSRIKNTIVELEKKMAGLNEATITRKGGSVLKSLGKAKDALATLKQKKGQDVNLTIKAAGTITTANVDAVGTNGISGILTDIEPGITPIPRSAPFFMDLFAAVPTDKSEVSYSEMKNPDGGAGMTGEGSAKTQADFDIVEAKASVKKVTAYIKTSKEALDDIPALAGEIDNELITLVKLKADSGLLSGDGLSNNLNGILTVAQAFTGGDLAGTIPTPNNYDVLEAAMMEVEVAEVVSGEPAGFMPNVIVLNPVDAKAMKLTKDSNGQYVFPWVITGGNILEIPVVKNARMTKGDFLVMDTTKANLRIREDVNVNIGYENDDFTKNLITILAEMRLCIYVKSQHTKAFVKGTFSTAKALLQSL